MATAERTDERFYEPELHRLRGELLAADPATSREAEQSFQRALCLARRQGSQVLARRAAASFATYLRARGRAVEAEAVLTEPDAELTGGAAAGW